MNTIWDLKKGHKIAGKNACLEVGNSSPRQSESGRKTCKQRRKLVNISAFSSSGGVAVEKCNLAGTGSAEGVAFATCTLGPGRASPRGSLTLHWRHFPETKTPSPSSSCNRIRHLLLRCQIVYSIRIGMQNFGDNQEFHSTQRWEFYRRGILEDGLIIEFKLWNGVIFHPLRILFEWILALWDITDFPKYLVIPPLAQFSKNFTDS